MCPLSYRDKVATLMKKLFLPEGPFGAYLFDCDGTIADSMPLHFLAWNDALRPYGVQFPRDLFYAWAGIPVSRTVEMLAEKFGVALPVLEVTEAREGYYLSRLPQILPVEEVKAEILSAAARRLPIAVVSGSPHASVEKTLSFLGLRGHFEVIIGAEDSARGKPFPDPFLAAAAALGVEPSRCLVFEDGELGIQAAIAAGMKWVRVPVTEIS